MVSLDGFKYGDRKSLFSTGGAMTAEGTAATPIPFWKKVIKPAAFIIIGIIIAFPLFSIGYYTMVRTSTPRFCATCHEIQWAYNTWKTSTHVNNAQGFVADCMDCHLPTPHHTIDFFYQKTFHGMKDIIIHFVQDEYDHKKNRAKAYAAFRNDQCMKCHRNLIYIPNKRGAMLAHKTVLYPRPGYEKKCVDCHRDLVHNSKSYYEYKQYAEPYRGLGI
jgi:cytochrome c-type protein NapC/trimethylamine-N-oxide reductase cytochrome c-type subunit TorC